MTQKNTTPKETIVVETENQTKAGRFKAFFANNKKSLIGAAVGAGLTALTLSWLKRDDDDSEETSED